MPSTINEDVANDEVRSAQRVFARTITDSASGTCIRTKVFLAVNTCERSGQASSDAGSTAPRHRPCGEGGKGIHELNAHKAKGADGGMQRDGSLPAEMRCRSDTAVL